MADGPDADSLTERRIGRLFEIARTYGVSIPLEELIVLLPASALAREESLRTWLEGHPEVATLHERRAVPAGSATAITEEAERADRGARYWSHAREVIQGPLNDLVPLTRCVGVTGSAAYGEPREGDDLDFMVVTRTGALWPFLAATFLRRRVQRGRGPSTAGPEWCFNYVLDDREALRDFGQPRGFLFAREALMTRILTGEAYYRGLVGAAGWLRTELPRLHARWEAEGFGPPPAPARVGWPMRLAGALVFPFLAAYLQLRGLRANHQLVRYGQSARTFRTVTSWRRYALETRHFDRLGRVLADSSALPAPDGSG